MGEYRKYEELTGSAPAEVLAAPQLPLLTVSAFGSELTFQPPEMRLAWTGFFALSGSRQWTMGGAGPILYSEIRGWLDEQKIDDPDDRDELINLINRMDQQYLKHVNPGAK